jgi:hypothetical protein
MNHDPYEKWLTERRSVSPSEKLPDQIMAQLAGLERQRRAVWWLRLVQQVEHSRAARWAVCCAALAIGGFPFLFLAYVSKFLTF